MCAPDAPQPIDPADSSLKYIEGISDPALQQKIISAERTYRPQYAELNLRDAQNYLYGVRGEPGLLDLYAQAAAGAEQTRSQVSASQRESDIRDVEELGQRATKAFRASDPETQKVIENQMALNDLLFSRAQGVTPQQTRDAQQAAREAFSARGRVGDNAAVAAEIINREDFRRQNRDEYARNANQTYAMLRSSAADPFQAILGRPAGAMDYGTSYANAAQGYIGASTPQLFDPDAGINLALQEQANMANFNANVYGSQMGLLGGLIGGAGSIIGGM